ncbi:hypothetical protein D3C77_610760 [compost metagenome]
MTEHGEHHFPGRLDCRSVGRDRLCERLVNRFIEPDHVLNMMRVSERLLGKPE